MNVVRRAYAILADPTAEWIRIEKEPGDAAYLLTSYAVFLALIPAVFSFIGACAVGAVVPGVGTVRAPVFDGVFGAVFGYVVTCAIVLVLGLLVAMTAPMFGGRRDFNSAFKLAVYSYTPVWLSGVFLLAPGLRFLGLLGLYGVYVLWIGLPQLMKSPEQTSPNYAALIVVCAGVLTFLAAVVQHILFGQIPV